MAFNDLNLGKTMEEIYLDDDISIIAAIAKSQDEVRMSPDEIFELDLKQATEESLRLSGNKKPPLSSTKISPPMLTDNDHSRQRPAGSKSSTKTLPISPPRSSYQGDILPDSPPIDTTYHPTSYKIRHPSNNQSSSDDLSKFGGSFSNMPSSVKSNKTTTKSDDPGNAKSVQSKTLPKYSESTLIQYPAQRKVRETAPPVVLPDASIGKTIDDTSKSSSQQQNSTLSTSNLTETVATVRTNLPHSNLSSATTAATKSVTSKEKSSQQLVNSKEQPKYTITTPGSSNLALSTSITLATASGKISIPQPIVHSTPPTSASAQQTPAPMAASPAKAIPRNQSASRPVITHISSPSSSRHIIPQSSSINEQSMNDFTGMSEYITPQLHFRLNRVSTLTVPELSSLPKGKLTCTSPVGEFLELKQLITSDAEKILLTTFKLDMEWLLSSVPALLVVPTLIFHGEENIPDRSTITASLSATEDEVWDVFWQQILSLRDQQLATLGKPVTSSLKKLPSERTWKLVKVKTKFGMHFPGCPHGKIGLIRYPEFLRVFVSTANLVSIDYTEKTQGIWFQDFPLIERSKEWKTVKVENFKKVHSLSVDFVRTLKDYLERLLLKFDTSFLDLYDFRNVRIVLISAVMSGITGMNPLNDSKSPAYDPLAHMTYGHLKLCKLLNMEPDAAHLPTDEATIFAQASSIGSISPHLLQSFSNSFRGIPSIPGTSKEPLTSNTSSVPLTSFFSASSATSTLSKIPIRIVWPSVEFVRSCISGWAAGGSLCTKANNLLDKNYMMDILVPYKPNQPSRQKVPPHIKSYWKIWSNGNVSWMCLTSANLSRAAWGEWQKDGSKFNMNNYEMGVLFLPSMISIPSIFGKNAFVEEKENNHSLASSDATIEDSSATPTVVQLKHGQRLNLDKVNQTITLPIPFDVHEPRYPAGSSQRQSPNQPWVMDVGQIGVDIIGTKFNGFEF